MDGWMDDWMDGWMEGWMEGWMDGGMEGWMGRWMDGWVGGWRRGWSASRRSARRDDVKHAQRAERHAASGAARRSALAFSDLGCCSHAPRSRCPCSTLCCAIACHARTAASPILH
eukprot:2506532-Rhodomonas_salina.3